MKRTERQQGANNMDEVKSASDAVKFIQQDPSTSFWLKRAVKELYDRDPVDAFADVLILQSFVDNLCKDAELSISKA